MSNYKPLPLKLPCRGICSKDLKKCQCTIALIVENLQKFSKTLQICIHSWKCRRISFIRAEIKFHLSTKGKLSSKYWVRRLTARNKMQMLLFMLPKPSVIRTVTCQRVWSISSDREKKKMKQEDMLSHLSWRQMLFKFLRVKTWLEETLFCQSTWASVKCLISPRCKLQAHFNNFARETLRVKPMMKY